MIMQSLGHDSHASAHTHLAVDSTRDPAPSQGLEAITSRVGGHRSYVGGHRY